MCLILPMDNYTSTTQQVHFKWEELEGVESYHLQIVTPSFSSPQAFIVDSSITDESFYINLTPGTYQWRIKGVNNSSETPYTQIRNIQIDSTTDLTGQTIQLLAPADNAYSNSQYPTLYWDDLYIADEYQIVVKSGSNWITGTVIDSDTVSTLSYAVTNALSSGEYIWGVRGINSTSVTDYSTRTLLIDLDVPGAPVLTNPIDSGNITSGAAFTYTWSRAADGGLITSPKYDSVYIYTNASLTDLYKRFETYNETHTDSISVAATYYWRVKTIDEAGNIGPFSSVFSFDVQ